MRNNIFDKVSFFFYNKTKVWLIGLFLILIVLLFISLPLFEDILGISGDHISLDKPQLYSPDTIHEILTDWGEGGRLKQFWIHVTWDLLLPIFYFFFLGFLIAWLSKRGFKKEHPLQKLCLVSLVAVIDLFENIFLFILIFIYPANVHLLGFIKTGLTLIKYYIFGPAILFGLVTSTIFAFKNKLKVQE